MVHSGLLAEVKAKVQSWKIEMWKKGMCVWDLVWEMAQVHDELGKIGWVWWVQNKYILQGQVRVNKVANGEPLGTHVYNMRKTVA